MGGAGEARMLRALRASQTPRMLMPFVAARRATGALLLAALLVAAIGGVSVAVPSEQKLEEAKERASELESRIDQAEAALRKVEAELEELEERLAAKQVKLDAALEVHREAEVAAEEASSRARVAEEELQGALTELEANTGMLSGLARDAYKYGAPSTSPSMTAMEMMGSNTDDLAERLHYLTRGLDARSDALERSDALRIEVEVLTDRALSEEREMQAREAEAQEKRDEAAGLHAQVQDLVSEHSQKLDESIRLVDEVEAQHAAAEERVGELEVQVEKEREEARLERERKERERRERERREQERREQERRDRERAAARTTSTSSNSSSNNNVSVRSGPTPQLRTVGGITVDASIAPQLQQLLNDARSDGIVFGGHGYRSPEVTARLRIANGCPDVYESPASSCRVPTARPGSSMHEKGLAIDFTYRGQTICYPRPGSRCSGNAGFDWLQQNAGKYGLRNLPTEAWHWSTNGR